MEPANISADDRSGKGSRIQRIASRITVGSLAIAMAVIVGGALRAYQLGAQIVADDEWHALDAALHMGYRQIASTFGPADHCIPLTLYFKLLSRTVGLTELGIRAPMFLAGLAAIVALPLLVRTWVGASASVLFAWLLAICPLHIYFSRYARPYSLTFLLVSVAVIAMLRWQRSAGRAWAVVYVACGVLAAYLHLIVLPMIVAPILFELGVAILRRRSANAPSLGSLVIVGAALALGVAGLLGVPLVFDARSMTQKAAAGSINSATLVGAFQLLTGSGHLALGLAMTLLAATGLASLWRSHRHVVLHGTFVVVAQVIAVVAARPVVIDHPIVFARYCLPILPLVLLAVACGTLAVTGLLRRRWISWLLAGAVVSTLFVLGPVPKTYAYSPNNFTNHPIFQYTYDDSSRYAMHAAVRPFKIPQFYRRLSELEPGSITVVEAPWHYNWGYDPFPFYQAVHRQSVVIGGIGNNTLRSSRRGEAIPGSGLDLEHAVHVGDAAGLQRRGIRFVIFHKSLATEFPLHGVPRVDAAAWVVRYRQQYGAPIYDDDALVVFEIGR